MTPRNLWLLAVLCLLIHSETRPEKSGTPKAWLGIAFKDLPLSSIPKVYQHSEAQGAVVIEQIIPGASAEQGGLKEGDIILAIDGVPLKGRATLLETILSKPVGSVVEIKIGRNREILNLKMALSPRPEDIRSITKLMVGSPATPLEGTFYHKSAGTWEDLKGKVVLLDFWATWCGPCRMTAPQLELLYEKYQSQGLEIIGISSESLTLLKEYQKEHPHSFPLLNDVSRSTHGDYSIMAFPTFVLVDKNGIIQRVNTGYQPFDQLEAQVTELLKL